MARRHVVLLTTWNRPGLLRQSLPHVEREARKIGAALVIADDQSDDPTTLALLDGARERGADLIRRPYVRRRDPAVDAYLHNPPAEAFRQLTRAWCGPDAAGAEVIEALVERRDSAVGTAHTAMQRNNLFGFRHVLATDPGCDRILKVDDDVVLADGAFETMLSTWDRAQDDGHDVLAVSGIRTVRQDVIATFPGYVITIGICNVAIAYRREDWELFLSRVPEDLILREGFDLAFVWHFGPRWRRGAAAVTVAPSVAYHAGFNGVHVRDTDLNCEYAGPLDDVVTR